MRLVGFNFTKISGEKTENKVESLNVNTKIDVKKISEVKSEVLKTKEEIISVKFYYGLEFNPKFAKLDFEGNILLSLESKRAKEIIKDWKNEKVNENIKGPLFNLILQKCNIKALQLEENLNLPPHFKFPTIKVEKKEEEKN